jgi:hypothetical protein
VPEPAFGRRREGRRLRAAVAARADQPRRVRPSRAQRVSAPLACRPNVLTSGDRLRVQDAEVLGEGARSSISARRSLNHRAVCERTGSLELHLSAEAPGPAVSARFLNVCVVCTCTGKDLGRLFDHRMEDRCACGEDFSPPCLQP